MKLTEDQFNRAAQHINMGRTTSEVAYICKISERMVQRVKEAGTWQRWPYIVAKATHGYNTPEYKRYLKRRGLPLTPPSKTAGSHTVSVTFVKDPNHRIKPQKKRSLLDRILRRK